MANYHVPSGGLPPQTALMTERAVFKDTYAVLPRGVFTDIVTSSLPQWHLTRFWIVAKPLSGFATSFSQYLVEVQAGGGSADPEPNPAAQAVLFVVGGCLSLAIRGEEGALAHHSLSAGSYVYLPAGCEWTLHNNTDSVASFHWIRKRYEAVPGIARPTAFVTSDSEVAPIPMADTKGVWSTTQFVERDDLRHDMQVNIVTFEPGGVIPFLETHVMEHGIFILEGKAVYRLNQDWVEVEAGDFLWLRAFCPQACYAGGPTRFRYLLYKDVNRHMPLDL